MEFTSPVYELMHFYEQMGVRFPPYWDLMTETDILKTISAAVGGNRGR